MIKLNYSLATPEERKELVDQILAETPNPSAAYLEILADYLVLPIEKQERKERKLLTENRMTTINKRECSFEGLVSQLENGEDGIYNLITENKNTIFQPKVSITQKDLEEIPYLKQLREAIQLWETKLKTATGHDAFVIKKTIIELRKDQYVIKNAFRKPVQTSQLTRSKNSFKFEEIISLDSDGYCQVDKGISLIDPKACQAILCNYSKLKQDSHEDFEGDLWSLMEDFDNISAIALKDYPLYEQLMIYKIDGLSNAEIQEKLQLEFGIKHSIEYISSLWRNKIPKLIASAAEDNYLDHYYLNEAKGQYKRCSRCGELKLAHPKYFSKNKTSKDGYYSICKQCRNSKNKK